MGYLYGEDLAPPQPALTRAVEAFEPLDDGFGLAWARFTRGVTSEGAGDPDAAVRDYALAFAAFEEADDLSGLTLVLGAFSGTLLALGRARDAYVAAGVASRWAAETGHPPRDDRARAGCSRSRPRTPPIPSSAPHSRRAPRCRARPASDCWARMLRELAAEGSAPGLSGRTIDPMEAFHGSDLAPGSPIRLLDTDVAVGVGRGARHRARRPGRAHARVRELRRAHGRAQVQAHLPLWLLPVLLGLLLIP